MTTLAFAIFEPSLARDPSTVTCSPICKSLLVQPFRFKTFGLANSRFQFVTVEAMAYQAAN